MCAQTMAGLRTEKPMDGQPFGVHFSKNVQRTHAVEFRSNENMSWIFLEVIYFLVPKQIAHCMIFIGMHYCNSNNLQSFLIYYVPGTIVGIGNISVNKTGTIPIFFKTVSQFSSNVLFFHITSLILPHLKKNL